MATYGQIYGFGYASYARYQTISSLGCSLLAPINTGTMWLGLLTVDEYKEGGGSGESVFVLGERQGAPFAKGQVKRTLPKDNREQVRGIVWN